MVEYNATKTKRMWWSSSCAYDGDVLVTQWTNGYNNKAGSRRGRGGLVFYSPDKVEAVIQELVGNPKPEVRPLHDTKLIYGNLPGGFRWIEDVARTASRCKCIFGTKAHSNAAFRALCSGHFSISATLETLTSRLSRCTRSIGIARV